MAASVTKQRFLHWLIIGAGIYALLPFILIAQYNQPSADDYFGAVRDAHQSFSSVFKDTYLHWSGRYFATIISRINPLLYHSPMAYKWYAVILLVAFAAALVLLVRVVTVSYFSWLQTMSLTSILLILYLAILPSTAEGFYWFSGSYIYQTANVFFMALLALLVKLYGPINQRVKYIFFILAILLAVCIIGCNEISLIITCCVVIVTAVHKYSVYKKQDWLLTTLALACIAAACVSVFAPGNFERMNTVQEYAKSPLWALEGAAAIVLFYGSQWAVPLLVCTILYVPLFGNPLAKKMLDHGQYKPIKCRYSFAFYILMFLLLQVFAVWVAGGSNLGRIENVLYLFFLLGWFYNVQVFIIEYWRQQKPVSFFSEPFLGILSALFFVTVLDINNNISTAYIDLITGNAKTYNNEQNNRMQLAKRALGDTCYVPPLTVLPKTIFFTDIKCTTDSLDFWMNKAYAEYAGIHYILVTEPLPPVKTNAEIIRDFGKETRAGVFMHRKG